MPNKYIAEISPVREVSLMGTAGLNFWTNKLRPEGLAPAASDGRAQVLISGVSARYMGIPFRELSVSVLVESPTGGRDVEYFLVHAFHSSRLLAFIERTCFSTPYYPAPLYVEAEPTPAIRLGPHGKLLRAQALSHADQASSPPRRDESWEITILLPRASTGQATPKRFYARLAGATTRSPFDPSRDVVSLQPSPSSPVLGCLLDSGFTASEWIIRANATHARSKTFARELPAVTMPR